MGFGENAGGLYICEQIDRSTFLSKLTFICTKSALIVVCHKGVLCGHFCLLLQFFVSSYSWTSSEFCFVELEYCGNFFCVFHKLKYLWTLKFRLSFFKLEVCGNFFEFRVLFFKLEDYGISFFLINEVLLMLPREPQPNHGQWWGQVFWGYFQVCLKLWFVILLL